MGACPPPSPSLHRSAIPARPLDAEGRENPSHEPFLVRRPAPAHPPASRERVQAPLPSREGDRGRGRRHVTIFVQHLETEPPLSCATIPSATAPRAAVFQLRTHPDNTRRLVPTKQAALMKLVPGRIFSLFFQWAQRTTSSSNVIVTLFTDTISVRHEAIKTPVFPFSSGFAGQGGGKPHKTTMLSRWISSGSST